MTIIKLCDLFTNIYKKGEITMNREKMNPSKDKQVFRNTAIKTKQININVTPMRGGIRL